MPSNPNITVSVILLWECSRITHQDWFDDDAVELELEVPELVAVGVGVEVLVMVTTVVEPGATVVVAARGSTP